MLNIGKLGWKAALLASVMLFAPVAAQAQDGFDFGAEEGAEEGGDGFDFGAEEEASSDSGSTTSSATTVDESSPAYASYKQAQGMIENKLYLEAAAILNDTIAMNPEVDSGFMAKLQYELGRALYEAGYPQSALNHFDMVLQQGDTPEVNLTLPYLVLIGRVLPGEPSRYSRIYNTYVDKYPIEVSDALTSEVGY